LDRQRQRKKENGGKKKVFVHTLEGKVERAPSLQQQSCTGKIFVEKEKSQKHSILHSKLLPPSTGTINPVR
jgi:hypothetical protein